MRRISLQAAKLLVVKFAGTFGSEMLAFAIGLYILKRTGSALSMGISLITGPLVSLCITPIVGYVVDTVKHRRVMVAVQAATCIALVVFALLFRQWPQWYYPELIGLIVALQVTDSFLYTAVQASLIQLFDGNELQQVNSLNQSMTSLASFLAPILGALIYTLVAIDTFAYIEVGFELVALIAIVMLKFHVNVDAGAVSAPDQQSILQNFVAGVRYIVSQKLVLFLSLASGAINFFFAALNLGLPYLIVHTLKLSNTQYGLTDSAYAVGMFVGGIWLSQMRLKYHPVQVSFFNLGLFSCVLAIMGLPVLFHWSALINTAVFIGLNALVGLLLVFVNTPWDTFMQQIIPEQMQGRYFALDDTLSTILMPLGTLVYGVLFDHFAALPIFAVTGGLLLIMTIGTVTLISRRHLLTAQGD